MLQVYGLIASKAQPHLRQLTYAYLGKLTYLQAVIKVTFCQLQIKTSTVLDRRFCRSVCREAVRLQTHLQSPSMCF